MSTMEKHHQVMYELVITEKNYVEKLELLQQVNTFIT